MNELTKIIETNHTLFYVGPWLWISLWIVASIVYRRSRGKAIFPLKPKESLYYEGWASGHSNSNIFTKLGGARNCLLVAVTPDSLIIQPRFPFNLMFLPEIYGLEYRIPRLNIRAVEKKGGIFGKGVEIQFIDVSGGEKSVRLYLRRTDEFLTAIGKVSN
ncbi:MAG TPA: hypothetical protein VJ440_01965 [Candidatus Brocadiaceae bacterium]|nr:hypothetical protein [Candidatus Brocadiaceae bacterium]